jgi:hypothetical protein
MVRLIVAGLISLAVVAVLVTSVQARFGGIRSNAGFSPVRFANGHAMGPASTRGQAADFQYYEFAPDSHHDCSSSSDSYSDD